MMKKPDDYIPANIKLRDYQEDLVSRSLASLAKHRAVIAQSPTGSGKTVMFLEIFRRCLNKGYGAMMVAHREELIFQCRDKLWKNYGVIGGIIMSGYKPMYHLPIQIASIQTLTRRDKPKNIKLIVVDEGHHSKAKSYRDIIKAYPDAKILAFTATPIRTNGEGFDDIFQELVCSHQIKWFEQNGYLCPAKSFINPIDQSQLSHIKVTAGDYNEGDLARFMAEGKKTADVVESYQRHAMGKRNCLFAVNIEHSKQLQQAFQAAGIPAAHVDGTTDRAVRKRIFDDFRDGKILVLCNVGIATEGVDIPGVECVQAVRPTKALWMYLQMVGRGSRIAPGKENYIFLDHANWIVEHGVPNADRKWTLKGKKKNADSGQKVRQFLIKFPNGETRRVTNRELPEGLKGVELVEVVDNYRVNEFEHYFQFALRRDWNKYWAFCKWLEKIDEDEPPSLLELQYIQQRLLYKPGWARMMDERLAQAQQSAGSFKSILQKVTA